jgi:hypothetical protein
MVEGSCFSSKEHALLVVMDKIRVKNISVLDTIANCDSSPLLPVFNHRFEGDVYVRSLRSTFRTHDNRSPPRHTKIDVLPVCFLDPIGSKNGTMSKSPVRRLLIERTELSCGRDWCGQVLAILL